MTTAAAGAIARIEAANHELLAVVSYGQALAGPAEPRGPLSGTTVGVKDVIDIAGLPTVAGSPSRVGVPPAERNAAVVDRLRAAGASIVAKTVTTELATMDPAPTLNPWNHAATPGGSSSGSAAAVAAGLVDLAVGTQTAGSVCRPAAYCGVSAIKPSYGRLPTGGVLPLAPSFDTLGLFARRVEDLMPAIESVTAAPTAAPSTDATLVIGVPTKSCLADASPGAFAGMDRTATVLRSLGHVVERVAEVPSTPDVIAHHRRVMAYEAWRAHGPSFAATPHLFGPKISELLNAGRRIGHDAWKRSLAAIEIARSGFWERQGGLDAILTIPVPGPAPDRRTTGPAHYLIGWTAFHGPLVVVPTDLDPSGLPLAVMFAAAPGADHALLSLATAVAGAVDRLPPVAPRP